jgi:hypothetical protein
LKVPPAGPAVLINRNRPKGIFMLTPEQRRKVVSALTQYDVRQERAAARARRPHNIYALGIMLGGVDRACEHKGSAREALRECFHGRLLDICLKAVGEEKGTLAEVRGDFNPLPF